MYRPAQEKVLEPDQWLVKQRMLGGPPRSREHVQFSSSQVGGLWQILRYCLSRGGVSEKDVFVTVGRLFSGPVHLPPRDMWKRTTAPKELRFIHFPSVLPALFADEHSPLS